MELIIHLSGSIEPGNGGHLVSRRAVLAQSLTVRFVVGPDPAHGIVNGGKNFHWGFPGVIPGEFCIDFEDPSQTVIEKFPGFVSQV